MQWTDDGQLHVETRTPHTITLSLHEANGIQITYHVPKLSMTPRFSEMDHGWRQWEEEFIHWASENAIVDEAK
jgi:uncharacterized protein YfaT (DUF1175 family)